LRFEVVLIFKIAVEANGENDDKDAYATHILR